MLLKLNVAFRFFARNGVTCYSLPVLRVCAYSMHECSSSTRAHIHGNNNYQRLRNKNAFFPRILFSQLTMCRIFPTTAGAVSAFIPFVLNDSIGAPSSRPRLCLRRVHCTETGI